LLIFLGFTGVPQKTRGLPVALKAYCSKDMPAVALHLRVWPDKPLKFHCIYLLYAPSTVLRRTASTHPDVLKVHPIGISL